MIYVNVILTVKKKADVAKVKELLTQQAALSRAEPGCARFEVYQSESDDKLFILIERWENQEDLDRHRKAKAFVEIYEPKVLPLVERIPHPSGLVSG
ncbi:MAG: putative quinol monooxygenase [Gammaproteobacteria bacterium]|jgi:quinol monooxygenase YgiN